MRRFSDYWDKWGLLVQAPFRNHDGGDSCSRTGTYYFLSGLLRPIRFPMLRLQFRSFVRLIEAPMHRDHYMRHPDPSRWYGDIHRGWEYFSRDQAVPLVLGMGLYKCYSELWGFTLEWLKRFMWMTNYRENGSDPRKDRNRIPDFAPQLLGCIIRSFYPYSLSLYPLLLITDLELLFSALIKVLGQNHMRKMLNGDQQNYTLRLIQAQYFLPTPLSALARWIYASFTGALDKSPKNPRYTPANGVQSRLQYFYREEKGDPPLDIVFRPIVEKW